MNVSKIYEENTQGSLGVKFKSADQWETSLKYSMLAISRSRPLSKARIGKCHHENEGQQLEKLLITMASLAPPQN